MKRAVAVALLSFVAACRPDPPTPSSPESEEFSLEIYDVKDLVASVPDFPHMIRPSPERLAAILDRDPQPAPPRMEPEALEEAVKELVHPAFWNEPALYELHRGQIIVNQTRFVHERIAEWLARARDARHR